MTIFISHTTSDDNLAKKIGKYLTVNYQIKCYIDDMDKGLAANRGKPELTEVLVENLRNCDTLLAVVTDNTKNSWWVPFEIGTAREMPRVISSFSNVNKEKLPEYLHEWPILTTIEDLEIFATQYIQRDTQISLEALTESYRTAKTASLAQQTRNFEIKVMKSLGQR